KPFDAAPLGINLNQLQRSAGVTRSIRWLTADWAKAPMAYGFLRPVIITPTHWSDECGPDQARWILMHELAHIRRGDYAVFVIQRLVQIVYFFHPLVWGCNNLIHHLREYSCDEMAAAASDASPRDCGEGLLRIAALSSGLPYRAQAVLGAADSERILRRRLMRILRLNTNNQSSYSWKTIVGLCMITASLVAFRSEPVNGQASVNTAAVVQTPGTNIQSNSSALKQLQKEVQKKLDGELGKFESVLLQRNVKIADLVVAKLATDDGDVMIASTPDPKASEASVVVTLNVQKNNNAPVSADELDKIKQYVGVKSDEANEWDLQAGIGSDLPKGFNVSLNIYALVPERMRLTTISGDGDMTIAGMSVVEAETGDGDVSIFNCSKRVSVISEDGNIHVLHTEGPVTVKTEDGDVLLENVSQCDSAQTGDGDIRIKNTKRCQSIITGDGDLDIDSLGQFETIRTGDGDVRVNVIESPEQDGSIESGDGTVSVGVKDDVKVSIKFDPKTSGKKVRVKGMDTQFSDDTHTITKNGGGKTIKVKVGEGEIKVYSADIIMQAPKAQP
ncbi:DUF4097 family beta strand repeat-containing protein, partial [bacterium]|nr:DUF4097 family beta strand repeat-containing protein [bacterium]